MANEVKLKLAVDGASAVVSEFDRVRAGMGNLTAAGSLAQSALGGLAAALSVTALVAWGRATLDAADAMNDLSQRVGISVKDLAKYELAAAQSGTTMEALAKGIKGIAGNLQEHGAALKKAGIDATTADGAMQQLADVFADMPDGMEKTTLAVKLFGKSGMDLIPMLNLGSAGLKTAAEKSAAYAEQMAVMAPLADAFNDNLALLSLHTKAASMTLANSALPAMVGISAAMSQAAEDAGILKAAWVGLGGIGWELIFKPAKVIWLGFNNTINETNASLMRFFGKTKEADDLMKMVAQNNKEILAMTDDDTPAAASSSDKVSRESAAMATYKKIMDAIGASAKTAKEAISEATKGLNLYLELMDKGAGFEKSWAKDVNELRAALDGKKISQSQYNAAIDQLLKKQPLTVEAEKLRLELAKENTKAVDEYTKHLNEQMDAEIAATQVSIDYAAAMAGINQATELELSMAGMTEQQRAIATKNRQIDLELEKQIAAIHKTNAAADVQAAQIAAVQATAASQRNRTANDVYRADWVKTATTIQDTLTDAFMGAIDNGKSLFVNLRDSVVGMFKNMVLRPMIQATVGSAMGMGASGAAMAGESGGNLLGVAGNLGSLYNTATSGIASIGTQLGSGMALTMQNGFISGFGANMAQMSLAVEGGMYATAAGMAVPYVGAAIAAVKVIQSLFSESREIERQGTQGTFSGTSFAGQNYTTTKVDPGRFSKTYHTTDYSAMDAKTASAWTDAFALLKSGAAASASTLGLATDKIAAYTKYIDIAAGTTAEQMTALFTGMADDMATATAPGLAALSRVGEASSATLARLSSSLVLANQWLANFNQTLLAGSLAGGDAASKLVDTFGGADKFAASQSAYYAAMYTEAERLAKTTENVAKGLALVGQAMPSNIEDFNKLRDGISLTSEEGRNAYAVMTALGPEFAQVANAAKAMGEETANLGVDLLRAKGMEAEAAAAQRAIDTKNFTFAEVIRYDTNAAIKKQIAQETERKGLQDQYDALTMTSTQLLDKQRNALDASNRGLFDQVTALEAQKVAADAASEAYKALATAVTSSLSAAVSEAEQALASAKEALQAAYSAEASALKATQDRFAGISSSFRDFADSLAGAIEAPAQSVERLQAEYARLSDLARLGDSGAASKAVSVGAQLKDSIVTRSATGTEAALALARLQASALATAGISDQQASIAKQSLDALTAQASALVTLNTSVLSVKDAVAAFQSTQTALDTARNAYLSRLGSEISVAISDGINGGSLKKSVDALTEGFTGFDINKSGGITLDELTAAMGKTSTKDQIAALFDAIDINKNGTIDQIDLLKSAIAASALATMDLAKNAYFNNATIGAGQVTTYSNGATAVKNADGTATFHGMGGQTAVMAITDSLKDLATRIPELAAIWKHDYGIDLNPSGAVGGSTTTGASLSASEQFAQTHATELARIQGFADAYFANSDPVGTVSNYYNGATATRTAKDFAQFSGVGGQVATMAKGDTILELAKRIPELAQIWAHDYGLTIPAFAKGTNYLPSDMLIQAHAGERIFPAADNRELMQRLQSPQANNEALVAEIRALRAEVQGLRAEARATATNTNKTAKLLDRAMPDGDALATRAAA